MNKKLFLFLPIIFLAGNVYAMSSNLKVVGLAASALAASAGAAQHHYHELRPFKDDAEREAVLKNIIMNESTFTYSFKNNKRLFDE